MTDPVQENPFERIIGLMVSQVRECALVLCMGGLALLSTLFVYLAASAYAGVLIRSGWLVVASSIALISVGHFLLVRYRFDRKIENCARECKQ